NLLMNPQSKSARITLPKQAMVTSIDLGWSIIGRASATVVPRGGVSRPTGCSGERGHRRCKMDGAARRGGGTGRRRRLKTVLTYSQRPRRANNYREFHGADGALLVAVGGGRSLFTYS